MSEELLITYMTDGHAFRRIDAPDIDTALESIRTAIESPGGRFGMLAARFPGAGEASIVHERGQPWEEFRVECLPIVRAYIAACEKAAIRAMGDG